MCDHIYRRKEYYLKVEMCYHAYRRHTAGNGPHLVDCFRIAEHDECKAPRPSCVGVCLHVYALDLSIFAEVFSELLCGGEEERKRGLVTSQCVFGSACVSVRVSVVSSLLGNSEAELNGFIIILWQFGQI